MRYLGLIVAALFLLAGCEDKPVEPKVFDEQLKTRDKARAVEGQLQESAERRYEQTPSGY